MKTIRHTVGALWLIAVCCFFLWDRNNNNGFWWTGFACFSIAIFAGTLTSVLEQGWIRALRIASVLGIVMNFIVVISNGGRMPVMFRQGSITGAWKIATSTDRFLWLCDRIPVGAAMCSIGDVFLFLSMIGILFLPRIFPSIKRGVIR